MATRSWFQWLGFANNDTESGTDYIYYPISYLDIPFIGLTTDLATSSGSVINQSLYYNGKINNDFSKINIDNEKFLIKSSASSPSSEAFMVYFIGC